MSSSFLMSAWRRRQTARKPLPSWMPIRASDKDSQNAQSSQRTIQVETGLETDYYIEMSSDELTEGMQVVVPQTSSSSSSDMMIMPGGGDMGGGGAPGGGMGGGGPM